MQIAETIRQGLDTMTRSERQVAAYSLENLNEIAFLTLDKLAAQIGISTTSVLRFCRRLGFDGFKDFQEAIRSELKYQPNLTEKFHRTLDGNTHDALLASTIGQNIACIRQTFGEMPYPAVCHALELLTKAKRVFTFGMRESVAMAHYAYSRLVTVRPDVYQLSAGVGDVESLLSLTEEDVCVAYLFHRYTRQSLRTLELLKNQNVPVILITSPPYEEVAQLATVLLPCQVDAGGIKNSFVAPICLADYLCNAMAMAEGGNALDYMKKAEELFRASAILGS